MGKIDRRKFMHLMGGAAAMTKLQANIARAQSIPANNATGSIQDVEHVIILMQENRPFDHHFGTLRGVRGYSDPRAVNINLPLQSGTGTTPVPVFLQPAGPENVAAGFAVPPNSGNLGGPADGVEVIPPFRVNPERNPGLTYLPGTDHSWEATHKCWNEGQYDNWAATNGPMTMSYMTRADLPYHYALADAFTVGDAYHCSIMGPTNPNRLYMWTGCVGNVNYLGAGGVDGKGAPGPITGNGLSSNDAYYVFNTLPEKLQAGGVTWKVYQDIEGSPFAPDFGDGTSNSFAGNFTDNSLLYFNQYLTAPTGTPLFQNGCTGTQIMNLIPGSSAPPIAWLAWAEHLFDQFRKDVTGGTLPQVSWVVAPAGYTEHSDWPVDYGAWYISQIFDILVSNPEVFSKTVFLINYDEADGSFDHLMPPTPPMSSATGASTVNIANEIVTTSEPNGPIGLGTRVPFLAISPWSKGGWVNSQVFDHTSVVRFIEKRFGVFENNISPWRRAVAGDLTSMFNFANPNSAAVNLPPTIEFLPPTAELAGGDVDTFNPTLGTVTLGVPPQEKGVRPARALPYVLNVQSSVDVANGAITLTFLNRGAHAAVFHVRSTDASEPVRNYTVGAGSQLVDSWKINTTYSLEVHGPNGFARYFSGSIGSGAANLNVAVLYEPGNGPSLTWAVTNAVDSQAEVSVLNAYTGNLLGRSLMRGQVFANTISLEALHGWYDLIVTVSNDPTFRYRLAGHVENGQDSFSDPAMGGLVTLKG